MPQHIGRPVTRREDRRFLTGQGVYLDDRQWPNMLHAVFVRSPYAHAGIAAIEDGPARAVGGVSAVLTGVDVLGDGLKPVRPTAEANVKTGEPFAFLPQPLLAVDKVRYVGEPVAMIVAQEPGCALDAAERLVVHYDPLPAVTLAKAAREPGAPQLAEEVPANVCFDWETGDAAGVEAAFAAAAHVVRLAIDNHRIGIVPMEPRGAVGIYDEEAGRYTLHVSSQNLHVNRDNAARSLGVPADHVRFAAGDVGGGFGAKNFTYPEYILTLWAARRLGRPIKWIATRSESFLSDHQSRDQFADAALALDAQGRFLALRVDSIANAGAYLMSTGGVQTYQYAHLPGTVYRIPKVALRIAGVITNTAPVGVTRGPGFAEASHIMERLIDAAARQCGFDRADLRRINMLAAVDMPMTNAFGQSVDSGAFRETFEQALDRAQAAAIEERRAASHAVGRLRGLGYAYHIKGTGGLPTENAQIRFEEDGTLALVVGTQTIGQGHETTFPQILAERLEVDPGLIRLHDGDSDLIAMGGGSASSRSTYMAGTAIWGAADAVIEKGRKLAAEMLEAAVSDVVFENGRFTIAGTDRGLDLMEVAARARAKGAPLDSYHKWTRKNLTFPNGAHVAEVEIDPDTGLVVLDRYVAVDDYGVQINPLILAGQVHGAIAQGIGQALLEHAAYDPKSGQPLAGSFLDYAMPRACDLPPIDLSYNSSPCTTNPIGAKGAGESGSIAAFPAIINAIDDALAAIGAGPLDGPATPERVWRAIQQAKNRP